VFKIKNIISDVLFVSRLTGVNKKKIRIISSVVLANLTVFFDILVILTFANLIDTSNTTPAFYVDFILQNIYLLPFIVILRFLFIFIEKMNIQSLQLKVEESLRTHLMEEVFDKSNYSVADAYFYVNELSRHVSYFYGSLTSSLNYSLQIVVYSIYLMTTSFSTIVYFLAGALFLFFPTKYFLKKGRIYVHQAYENEHKTLETIQKVLENIYLIKILETTKRETDSFKKTLRQYYSSVLNNFKFGAINNITPNFVTIFILSVLISFYNFAKILTLEFIGVMLRLFQTLGNLNNTLNLVINSHVHLEKLNLLERNKINSKDDKKFLSQDLNSEIAIDLKNVKFNYFGSEEHIFENLNISFKRNLHTVITGDNGSGKSTLIGLLSGILKPDGGKIHTYSQKFAYVGATPLIIKGTLKDNLLYGNDERVQDKDILHLVKTYKLFSTTVDSILNKEVSNKSLSSGQMQKISFIRAMLSKPDILILDESTSNLDYDSRKLINDQLKKQTMTIINSTHSVGEIEFDLHLHIDIKDSVRRLRLI
jgi:ABC-type multidrug transport system fused ATPase/permease subunit|tara:strand:- start:49489 stop:51099 length:1611 start_codon:yes stop_codon:yes gene_type:complete